MRKIEEDGLAVVATQVVVSNGHVYFWDLLWICAEWTEGGGGRIVRKNIKWRIGSSAHYKIMMSFLMCRGHT